MIGTKESYHNSSLIHLPLITTKRWAQKGYHDFQFIPYKWNRIEIKVCLRRGNNRSVGTRIQDERPSLPAAHVHGDLRGTRLRTFSDNVVHRLVLLASQPLSLSPSLSLFLSLPPFDHLSRPHTPSRTDLSFSFAPSFHLVSRTRRRVTASSRWTSARNNRMDRTFYPHQPIGWIL